MQQAPTQAPPWPTAHFCATVAEQQESIVTYALDAQATFGRIVEMLRIIVETADGCGADDDAQRVRICAEVSLEGAELAQIAFERVETAGRSLARALRGETTHA